MGRHGSGGSDSDQDPVSTGAFWVPPEQQPRQPGWPQPPDVPEVTGAWARPPEEQLYHLPAEETAELRWEQRPTSSEPPEPGDIKVAGAPVPAWAETRTTALGPAWTDSTGPAWSDSTGPAWSGEAGWPAGEELRDEGSRRRRRPHPDERPPASRGKGKAAFVTVAAVAVVLGGSVVGVRMMNSQAPDQCADGSCLVASGQPVPTVSHPQEESTQAYPGESTEPVESPTPKATGQEQRTPRRTTSARPTPATSRLKQSQPPVSVPEPDFTEQAPTVMPIQPGVTQSNPAPTHAESTPAYHDGEDDEEDEGEPAPQAGVDNLAARGGRVNVGFDVLSRRGGGYTAEVSVTNETGSPLIAATVSVPVSGSVFDVAGANWTQDGDLLILDLPGELAPGGSATVTVSAQGEAQEPVTCGVVGAECVVG